MSEVQIVDFPVESALVPTPPKPEGLAALIKDQDKPALLVAEAMNNFDWKALKPPHMAMLLMSKPFPVKNGGLLFLNLRQALYFAVRCYELGVSPFSDEVFFDPSRFSVNLTLAGKKAVARNKGIDMGPPQFEELSRDWEDVPRVTESGEAAKKAGFTRDIGYRARIRIGNPEYKEYAEYTAWLSEWFVKSSPVWNEKAAHMLQTRSAEKAISLALGTGASEMVGNEKEGE